MKPHTKRRARRPPTTVPAVVGGRRRSTSHSSPCSPSARSGPTPLSRLFRSDTGAVTAEFASVLPAVLIMAVLLAALGRGVMVSVNCQDAASAAARTAISTGDDDAVKAAAQSVAGQDTTVDIDVDGGTVTVVTRCPVIPDPMGVLPSLVKGEAVGVLT